jgi:hypothetical protein
MDYKSYRIINLQVILPKIFKLSLNIHTLNQKMKSLHENCALQYLQCTNCIAA